MNETNKKEQSLSEKLPNYTQESDLNLIEIWFALLRRKKLVGFITILFFITSLFYSVYKPTQVQCMPRDAINIFLFFFLLFHSFKIVKNLKIKL